LVITTIIAVIGGGFLLFFKFNGQLKPDHSPTQSSQNLPSSPEWQKGDINHDGRVNAIDKLIIKKSFNCRNSDPCWQRVVGKTDEGDNPIYTADLDLNNDGIINTQDLEIDK